MKIVTCIKQVRDLDLVLPQDWTVGPDGFVDISYAKPILNTYDENALEMMLRVADQDHSIETAALTIGGEESETILEKALAIGVDQGVRIENCLDPPHSPCTSASLLARAIGEMDEVSLVLCGRQAGMNDHGQTGLLLAERLAWPCISLVTAMDFRDGSLVLTHQVEEGLEEVEVTGPVVATVTQAADCYLRMATLKAVLEAKKKKIHHWTAEEVEREEEAQSFLRHRIYAKQANKMGEMMVGREEQQMADRLLTEIAAVREKQGERHDH